MTTVSFQPAIASATSKLVLNHGGSHQLHTALQPLNWNQSGDKFASAHVNKTTETKAVDQAKNAEKKPQKVYQFGTSGYRAIGKDFTDAVPVLTNAITDYLVQEAQRTGKVNPVLIGGDTRPLSHREKDNITFALLKKGFDVYTDAPYQTPTPVLAYAAKHLDKLGLADKQSAGAILLTASHNPWSYGGYNFLTNDGEVAPNSVSDQFIAFQKKPLNLNLPQKRAGKVHQLYPRIFGAYEKHLQTLIDFNKIRDARISISYDPMYGAATAFFPDLMANMKIDVMTINNANIRPSGVHDNGPDPTAQNLTDLATMVKTDSHPKNMKIGIANDGDADRFGILDENGKFIQPNDVLSLALYHLAKNKKRAGTVARSQATSHILDEIAKRYNMTVEETPVGYKYISEVFKEHPANSARPVVLGGESSGGLSVYGHVPEKDGIVANLTMIELMAFDKKPLSVILKDLKASLPTKYGFTELAITTDKKDDLAAHFAKLAKDGGQINGIDIDVKTTQEKAAALKEKFHTTDGTKLYLKGGDWVLVRKSGTEPMARIYFEVTAPSDKEVTAKRESMMKYVNTLLTSEPFKIDTKSIKIKVNE
jgi:phosphomannomutase